MKGSLKLFTECYFVTEPSVKRTIKRIQKPESFKSARGFECGIRTVGTYVGGAGFRCTFLPQLELGFPFLRPIRAVMETPSQTYGLSYINNNMRRNNFWNIRYVDDGRELTRGFKTA